MLTQAAWLDVDYGVPIQKWMLDYFRIVAVLETEAEPWFSDARVATVVTILKRKSNQDERANNLIRFVQFRERLTNIIGATANEEERQRAVERLRDRLLATAEETDTAEYRMRVISQRDLEAEGTDDEGRYIGSKWGRYLRSTDTLYKLQTQHSDRFVPLRTLAPIQRGITTNCDDFFLVTDASAEIVDSGISAQALRDRFGVTRRQVEAQQIAIVRRSDGVEMPLERHRLRPILKTARNYHYFATRRGPITDYAVFIPEGRDELSRMAREYVEAGEREGWHRAASFENIQNAGGNWYSLREADVAPIFFVKTIQYTPLVILNDAELLANQRLYKAYPAGDIDTYAMCAVLNSTVIACERYAAVKALGREAAIDIEVFSANALRTPNLRRLNDRDVERLRAAMRELARREVSEMLEEPLRDIGFAAAKAYSSRHPVTVDLLPPELQDETRQEIDRLVLKSIGIPQREIEHVREQMYLEIVEHIRKLRLLELEAQINRQGTASGSAPSPRQLADEIWADIMETEQIEVQRVPDDFLEEGEEVFTLYLPAANRIVVEERSLFDSSNVFTFRLGRTRMEFETEDEMAYALLLAEHGATGDIPVPADSRRCRAVTQSMREYLDIVVPRLREAAAGLTNNEELQNKIIREGIKLLVHR